MLQAVADVGRGYGSLPPSLSWPLSPEILIYYFSYKTSCVVVSASASRIAVW